MGNKPRGKKDRTAGHRPPVGTRPPRAAGGNGHHPTGRNQPIPGHPHLYPVEQGRVQIGATARSAMCAWGAMGHTQSPGVEARDLEAQLHRMTPHPFVELVAPMEGANKQTSTFMHTQSGSNSHVMIQSSIFQQYSPLYIDSQPIDSETNNEVH